MRKGLRIAGVALVAVGFMTAGISLAYAQQEESVSVVDDAYQPREIEVDEGATVTWTNNGDSTHTVTSSDGDFDASGDMDPGDSFSVTFEDSGDYDYYCEYHGSAGGEGMAGTVTVLAQGAQAPTESPTPSPAPTVAPDENLPQTGPNDLGGFLYLAGALILAGALCLRAERSLG
jgi:plastocyanin